MRRRLAAWLLLGLGCLAQAPVEPSAEVAFWRSRCERDPADAVSPSRLGQACLRQLRLTGRAEWEGQAESALRQALDRDPGQSRARVALAGLWLRQHRLQDAEAQAEAAVRAGDARAEALAARGDVRLELGRLAEARVDFGQLATLSPGWAAESRLARLEFLEGHPTAAADRLERLLAAGDAGVPEETRVLVSLQLGELRFRTGDLARAESSYARAQALAPGWPVVRDHVAELRAAQGRTTEAVGIFEALARQTDRPEYQQAVGDLLSSSGDPASARPWHDRALAGFLLAAERGDRRYDHHLATFYSDVRRDGPSAVRWAERDLAARPTAFAADALAWALHVNGDGTRARAVLERALASGIQDAALFFHAAMISLAAGDKASGRQWLARAAAVNPGYRTYHFHR